MVVVVARVILIMSSMVDESPLSVMVVVVALAILLMSGMVD